MFRRTSTSSVISSYVTITKLYNWSTRKIEYSAVRWAYLVWAHFAKRRNNCVVAVAQMRDKSVSTYVDTIRTQIVLILLAAFPWSSQSHREVSPRAIPRANYVASRLVCSARPSRCIRLASDINSKLLAYKRRLIKLITCVCCWAVYPIAITVHDARLPLPFVFFHVVPISSQNSVTVIPFDFSLITLQCDTR